MASSRLSYRPGERSGLCWNALPPVIKMVHQKDTLAVFGAINNSPSVTSPTSSEKREGSVTTIQRDSYRTGQIDRDIRKERGEEY